MCAEEYGNERTLIKEKGRQRPTAASHRGRTRQKSPFIRKDEPGARPGGVLHKTKGEGKRKDSPGPKGSKLFHASFTPGPLPVTPDRSGQEDLCFVV